jgi:hypothetical protein
LEKIGEAGDEVFSEKEMGWCNNLLRKSFLMMMMRGDDKKKSEVFCDWFLCIINGLGIYENHPVRVHEAVMRIKETKGNALVAQLVEKKSGRKGRCWPYLYMRKQ